MSLRPSCQTADFFVLRSPALPVEALFAATPPGCEGGDEGALRQILRELIRRKAVREAVALASPDLDARLDPWLDGSLEGAEAQGVARGLLKYLSRMCGRATPFGLFAAVSTGAWGPASRFAVGPWQDCRKALRLDWGVLESLVDLLEESPEVRARTTYRPNSSLAARGGWYRYLERRSQAGGGRTYHLEAAEATPHLDFALQQARGGVGLDELTRQLADHLSVAPEDARAFLDQIVAAQVLCGDLQPPLTSPDPLGQVIRALQAHPDTAAKATPLQALAAELDRVRTAPLGEAAGGPRRVAAGLEGLGLPAGTRDLLQVDLFRPAPELALSPVVRRALEAGAETLRRLTLPPPEGPLDRFRAAFQARYDARWVPLLEALDEEGGLGFDGGVPADSPLLEGVPFPGGPAPRLLSPRDRYLLAQVPRWQGLSVWELGEAEMAALAQPDPPAFPASFAALVSLGADSAEALDQGEFQFWMEHHSGPTAARWLGRFASGDPVLKDRLQAHLRKEEAARPDAAFAEVLHAPEGRLGNVLARPALRDFEIPFLATAGVPAERILPPSDLEVTVRGRRVHLASRRLGREVVPRLSSAHNFNQGPVVYRFLAHLQDQDGRSGGWSWGALADQPFLPRVTRGRQVLAKARWRIEAADLKAALAGSGGEAWGAFQSLRKDRGLPRFVLLTEADNALLVDLDEGLWVETLRHLVANRAAFTLVECFPGPAQALLAGPEGRFAHELVIPFEAAPSSEVRPAPLPAFGQAPESRSYAPGSEWLYAKVYGGPASADRLLVDLDPLIRECGAEGLWDRWHFLRYLDPHPHLRLRFHGEPRRLVADLLPRLHAHLEIQRQQGLLWTWQLDTFEPEWERYGGPQGFPLAEQWFFEDSREIQRRLVAELTPEARWRAGLRGVDAIWAALGLGLEARRDLARAARERFRKEFRDDGEGAAAMGAKFRDLRRGLEAGFPLAPEDPLPAGLSGLPPLREAFDRGVLSVDLPGLAASLSHMHLNRLLRSEHRAQEWVLMEFLARLYESRVARRGPGTSP